MVDSGTFYKIMARNVGEFASEKRFKKAGHVIP